MLKDIFDVVKQIGDFIASIVMFVIDMVEDLVYMVGLLGETVVKLPDYLNFLPATVIATITVIFSIVVIYKILGREG